MTIRYAVFVGLTLGLTGFLGYSTFATARLLKTWRPDYNVLLLPPENVARIGLILFCLGLGWLSGVDRFRLGWQAPVPAAQLGWGTGIGAGLGLFFYFATQWLIKFTGRQFYSDVVLACILPANNRQLGLVLLALGPAVLLEELLFRSLLLGGLSLILPAWGVLIALAILFGVFHSPQGTWGMIGAGAAGLLLGLLFWWQHSLLAPLAAHYSANALQVILAMKTGSQTPPPIADQPS